MGLWDYVLPAHSEPLLSPAELERLQDPQFLESSITEIAERQQHFMHQKTERFGPSYTLRPDGSFREHDNTFCYDCGHSAPTPQFYSQ